MQAKKQTPAVRRGRPMIPVIRITNPFNPREFVREQVAWQRKKTLDTYFPLAEAAPVVVSINGKVIERAQFGVTYLDKTDNVVICPVPTGGGGSKQILSIVALIAVSVVTAGAGAAVAGAMMGTDAIGFAAAYGGLGVALANGALTIAGSLLVSSIFAPPKASAKSSGTSSSYGVDGAKSTSVEGIPVPVNYGEFRMGGNILGLYTENVADDNQILYMLLSAGEGPIASISDIELNDNPLSDYGTDVEIQTRLGASQQAVIPWFSKVIAPQSKSAKLSPDWTYHTTTTAVDMIRLDVAAPTGLFKADTKSGETKTYSVPLEAQYRPAGGTGQWVPFGSTDVLQGYSEARSSQIDGTVRWYDGNNVEITDPATLLYLNNNSDLHKAHLGSIDLSTRVPVYSGQMSITGSKRSAVRRSFTSPQLPNQKYELRMRRVTAKSTDDTIVDEVYLEDVNEIVVQQMSYPNTALLALKITLGTKISGTPTVTFMHGGRIIDVYGRQSGDGSPSWYTAASKNPAWIVWDILTNKRYGGSMSPSRLDFPAFQEWADYCEAQGYLWNGPIDSEMNVWDATQLVLRVGHSQLVNVGTRYTIVTEKPGDPVMMFSVANMIEGTFKETWLGTQDRANEIDVTYFDSTDKYKQRTLKVYDPAALTSGAKQRTSAITLYGVTDYETAYKEGQFQLNLNRYILRTAEFSAPLEAVACSVGDLIYVQHDMTEWAQAGRFESGSGTSYVQLDRPVTMVAGKQYKLLVTFDAIQRTSGSVVSVVGTSVFLSGFNGTATVKRININGRDLRIAGTFDYGGGFGVIVDDATGIQAGQPYTLWDTDVIEEANVVNDPGEHTAITLQAPLSSAPAQFANWMFGEVDKVKQRFRVKAVAGTQEYRRDITAVEYKPEVYDFARYGSDTATFPPATEGIGAVRNLSLYEETYVAGSAVVTSLVASWSTPQNGSYGGADVFVRKNDGLWTKAVDAKNVTSAVISAAKGDVVTVQVQAYDIFGKRSLLADAPTTSYTVIGEVAGLQVGDVTGAGFTWAGRDCKISWRYNSTTHSYEFGSEPTGADAGALDPHFKDYEIRVYDKAMNLRRTEYTTDNSYVYIYDKNFADGLERHLMFEIRMRDIFNNIGAPATLDAYNPPPTIVSATADPSFDSATISYVHSGDPDFAGARIWVSEIADYLDDLSAPIAASCLVYDGPDSAARIGSLMFNLDHYYRIAPYDAFGPTELAPSATLKFRTKFFDVNTIKDEMIPVAKFAKDIDPVGIVDVLPDPATWVRPLVVFLTKDGKMYRLTNGKWVNTVESADITGQLVAAQIADAAINTAKFAQGISPIGMVDTLPAVAGYTGPTVVLLKTDGKMYRLVNGAWTSAIPAVDITGQLTNAQLADIAASKIAGQLTNAQLADIATTKLTGQITNTQIADNAISTPKIAAGAITTGTLAAGAVTANEIAANAVTSAKISAGAVSAGKIAAGAVTASEIATDTITAANIAAGAVTASELAANSVTAGKVAANAITAGTIAAGAVSATEIAAGAITTAKLAAGAVTANELAANSITSGKIAAGAVTAGTLAANAVTAGTIAAGAVSASQISAGAISADKLATGQLLTTSAQIGDGLIVNAKIGDAQVNTLKIGQQAVTIPVSAYVASGTTINYGSNSVQSITINSSGAPITIAFACCIAPAQFAIYPSDGSPPSSGNAPWSLEFYRDGTRLFSGAGPIYMQTAEGIAGTPSFVLSDTPGVGYHTYEMRVVVSGVHSDASGGYVTNRIINLLETKR